MPDLTADGSDTPTVLFEDNTAVDVRLRRVLNGSLEVQGVPGTGAKTWLQIQQFGALKVTDGTNSITAMSISPPTSDPAVRSSAGVGEVRFTSMSVDFKGVQVHAPHGVGTWQFPLFWDYLSGELGSVSPKVIQLGTAERVRGANVMLEDPNSPGKFNSIPLDSSSGTLGVNNYFSVERKPAGPTSSGDVVKIFFNTAIFDPSDGYSIACYFDEP